MTLHVLSPLDGRYESETRPLRDFFSEFAYLRAWARLELDFLSALSKTGIFPADTLSSGKPDLQNFTENDARKIQEYEKTTRHDVKAIEYFLRDKFMEFSDLPLAQEQAPALQILPFIHFGLTSEDINNIAQAMALRTREIKFCCLRWTILFIHYVISPRSTGLCPFSRGLMVSSPCQQRWEKKLLSTSPV